MSTQSIIRLRGSYIEIEIERYLSKFQEIYTHGVDKSREEISEGGIIKLYAYYLKFTDVMPICILFKKRQNMALYSHL